MATYINDLYSDSLTTLTDLYQLTMAQGYFHHHREDDEAIFYHHFREPPFGGGYAVAAGMSPLAEFIDDFSFDESDLEYLSTLKGNDGDTLFEDAFLNYLGNLELDVNVRAVPEGTLVFPHEPIVTVKGPLLQCQILETAILNIVNFQTLIATKARRIVEAAGDGVLEFGLRRAQGIDGGVSASRAAMIGGCSGTSNMLAGKLLDVPVKGTHAHSWVCSFDTEMESFEAYAEALPDNCVFLVDTYDTLEGTKKAIEVGKRLRDRGYDMIGIRLDSGDLADLSKKARTLLDEAGFEDAKIVASDGLDEYEIRDLKQRDAGIALWGVGTNLATAKDDPALGGVYKLSAVRDDDEGWHPRMKVSSPVKTSVPGDLTVRRYYETDDSGNIIEAVGDQIVDRQNSNHSRAIVDPTDSSRSKEVDNGLYFETLQERMIVGGDLTDANQWHRSIDEIAEHAQTSYDRFHDDVKRLHNAHRYPAGLEKSLYERREQIIEEKAE